jgi:hypothetical protein
MAKTTKPTKQQVAQAKARAGGNNPVKVTDAGLKKLGSAAVLAASLTPSGRAAVKTAGAIAKGLASSPKIVRKIQGKKMVERNKKAVNFVADIQQKVKAETIAKNSVKTKPAMTAKQRAEKNSAAKAKVDTAKSGAAARYEAGKVEAKRQLPAKVVEVKSGKDVKSAASSKRKLESYTPNPGRLPNLIKIDSAKGNSVKKTAYRPNKRSSK